MSITTIDFETFYRGGKTGRPSVRVQGNYAYCHDPEWEPILMSVCDDEESWVGPVSEFNWEALRGRELVAHNAAFDRCVYRRLVELKLAPDIGALSNWHCSADMSAFVLGKRSLKDAMEAGFGEHMSKTARDDMSGLRYADLRERGILKASMDYARRDAVDNRRLWVRYSPQWPEVERRLSDLTILQRERGVAVDVPALDSAIETAKRGLFAAQENMPWIRRGAKPTSMAAVYEECRRVGIACPPTKTDDEEGYLTWEMTHRDRFPWVVLVGHHRSITKVLSGLQMLRERIREDGRFEFDMLYFGGHTGRWSSPGFNMQNLRATPLVIDLRTGCVIDWQDFTRGRLGEVDSGRYGIIDVRALFIPSPGHSFIDCDLSQIEPRVLDWCAGNTEALAEIARGGNRYEVFARAAGRWSESGSLKSGNPALYKLCKIQVLQLGYQSGADKFRAQAYAEGIELKRTPRFQPDGSPLLDKHGKQVFLDEAEEAVREYRTTNDKVVKLWDKLDAGLKQSVGSDFVVELPSGRTMKYNNVRQMLKEISQDEDGKVRKRWQCFVNIAGHFGRIPTYGGKLTENLVQAISRDVFGLGMLRVEDAGIRTLWGIHDQVISEVPTDTAAEACETVRRCMAQTPEWLPGCPIDAESSVQNHYTK